MFKNPMLAMSSMMFESAMLAFESQQVVAMRLTKFAMGGPDVQREAELMVSEKMASLAEASKMMMLAAIGGKSDLAAEKIVKHYRKKVGANVKRLSA